MQKNLKFFKLAALAGVLPFIYGCGSGGGTSALLGLLFGGAGVGGSTIALLSETAANTALTGGATEVAALVNPEPASMLLVGGGLAAMTYFKSKAKHNEK